MMIKVGHFKFHLKDECLLRSVEAIKGVIDIFHICSVAKRVSETD